MEKASPPKAKPIRHHVLGARVTSDLKAAIEADAALRQWSVSQWMANSARTTLTSLESKKP